MAEGHVLGGRYRLIEQLGRGGMGSVWRAQRLTNQAEVAIKLIDPELAVSKDVISRFRREAQAAETIRSTHVVQILDYDVDNGTPFIVMELLKGEDLSKRLLRERRLTPEQTAIILGQLAKAIAIAHDHGIVHRDLKPENVFIVREHEDEIVKVLDFGIAKHHSSLGESSGLHTKTGMILGTPYYMSPEQVSGQEASHLADIWSFAVIAFECITSKRAFSGGSFLELGTAICKDPMPVPSAHGQVPDGFDAWFAEAAARTQCERFQSIKAAADALQTVCGHIKAQAAAASSPSEHGATRVSADRTLEARDASNGGAVAANLQTTAAPSSRSLPGLAEATRPFKRLVVVPAAALVVVTTALGVRMLGIASRPSSATNLSSSERVTGSVFTANVPQETIEARSASQTGRPIALTPRDAGVVEMSPDRPAKLHQVAQAVSRHSRPSASAVVPPAAPAVASTAPKTKYQPEF